MLAIKLSKICQLLDDLGCPRKTFSWEVQKPLGNSSSIRCFTLKLNTNGRKFEIAFDLCFYACGLNSGETDTWAEEKAVVRSQSYHHESQARI